MKQLMKALCPALAAICLLSACMAGDGNPTASTKKPVPSTKPKPVIADLSRPLPVLAEKKVTDQPGQGDLVLAQDGTANATIIYPVGQSKAKSAADDLANYLKQITGAAFTVIADDQALPSGNLILVGMTQKTAQLGFEALTGYPESEKYYIGVKENCLVLYGNDDNTYTCTQYAVTRFLEEAGCGWFAEENLWNVVPNKPTLAVKPWDQTFAPRFATRQLSWVTNTPIYKRWYLGGDAHTFGHTLWYGDGGLVHMNEYAEHPEWFAMINGVRSEPAGTWQYCYTNRGFIETVAERILGRFKSNPNLTTFSVSANDAWDEGWCGCEDCVSKGNRADQMLYFANEVAKITTQTYPDKTINFLAYHATFLPPENMKAHPSVEVMFTMETNPFTDPTLDYVVHEGFNGMTKVEYTQSWQDNVRTWIDRTDLQHVTIWSWLCISTGSGVWMGAPWVQGNTISNTYDLYEELGVTRIFADPDAERKEIRWPLMYVYTKCMWDDAVDGETVLYDACQKLYGEAADEMFLFYRILADCAAVNVDNAGLTWVPPSLFSVYAEHVNEIRDAVAAARAKLDLLTYEQGERVKFHLSTWGYAEAVM